MHVSIIGLGKLGSPMAAVLAHKGHHVIGVDLNQEVVGALNEGRAPVDEPGLQALLDRHADRIEATTDYNTAIAATSVTFIIVPTPSDANGFFSNDFVLESVQRVGEAIRTKTGYHVVVVTSTVMPGTTGGEVCAALEAASGRRVGEDLGLCYNPEFIALGSVVRDMLNPDMILIGESDPRAGDTLDELYRTATDNDPQIHRMNFVNAELVKISVNTFVTTKISYANMIAEVCDLVPHADVDVVSRALGADSRIGGKYLRGATGYGGPCFPRDNRAFSAFGRGVGARTDIADATDRINDHQLVRLEAAVTGAAAPGDTIAVLGLSYKPDTAVVEAAQGLLLAKALADAGLSVTAYDPLAIGPSGDILDGSVRFESSAASAVAAADVIVITTPWREFSELTADDFESTGRPKVVVDPWRVLDEAAKESVRCIIPGVHRPPADGSNDVHRLRYSSLAVSSMNAQPQRG